MRREEDVGDPGFALTGRHAGRLAFDVSLGILMPQHLIGGRSWLRIAAVRQMGLLVYSAIKRKGTGLIYPLHQFRIPGNTRYQLPVLGENRS